MPINLQDFVRQRQEEASDADRQGRDLSGPGGDAMIMAQLETLAMRAAEGAPDIDLALAALLENLAEDKRDEAVQRFRSRVNAVEKETSLPPLQMTPEQEQMLQRMKEQEHSLIAYLLHEKTLEKLRRVFLLNPVLWEQVMGISEQLQKRGVFTQMQRVQSTQLGQINAPAVKSPDIKKDQERER